MLIDIFARRYEGIILRDAFEQRDSRLLVQAFRILAEDIYPYYHDGKEDPKAVAFWANLHQRLSRELGLQELSKLWFSYTTKWNGNDHVQTHKNSMLKVCENWLMQAVNGSADDHIKDRISLIELGFRDRQDEIRNINSRPLPSTATMNLLNRTNSISSIPTPKDANVSVLELRRLRVESYNALVAELNARFKQAGYNLHYHNGFIQFSTDNLIQSVVETPFWEMVASVEWRNVDQDIKEAMDLRDAGGADPAFYAARALESTIKIISDKKGGTTGKEKGAHNYIDNLASRSNAFIVAWESSIIKDFFTHVRNPLGHGAGSAQIPSLSDSQTEWAIEFSMSWIKNLIRRL